MGNSQFSILTSGTEPAIFLIENDDFWVRLSPLTRPIQPARRFLELPPIGWCRKVFLFTPE